MEEKGTPYLVNMRMKLADDGNAAALQIVTDTVSTVALTREQLTIMIGDLVSLARQWEERMGTNPNQLRHVAAIVPETWNVGTLEDLGVGLSFHSGKVPTVYHLTADHALQMGHALIDQANQLKR